MRGISLGIAGGSYNLVRERVSERSEKVRIERVEARFAHVEGISLFVAGRLVGRFIAIEVPTLIPVQYLIDQEAKYCKAYRKHYGEDYC